MSKRFRDIYSLIFPNEHYYPEVYFLHLSKCEGKQTGKGQELFRLSNLKLYLPIQARILKLRIV